MQGEKERERNKLSLCIPPNVFLTAPMHVQQFPPPLHWVAGIPGQPFEQEEVVHMFVPVTVSL
jgi:hypothetical protein